MRALSYQTKSFSSALLARPSAPTRTLCLLCTAGVLYYVDSGRETVVEYSVDAQAS